MNILNALHTLLQGHPQQVQAPRNAGMLQQARTGGQIQLQNTGNNQPMGAAIQHNGGNIQQQGYTPAQMHQMTPVGHPIPQAMMDSFSPQTRQLAELYQHNPMDPRVMHIDPKMFGYAPDNTARPPSSLHQLVHGRVHGGSPQGYPSPGLGGDYDGRIANSQQLARTVQPMDMQGGGFGRQIQGSQQPWNSPQGNGGVSDITLQGSRPRYTRGNISF